MKILLLGGTRFLGRRAVDVALARGHEVTLFTRGRQPNAWSAARRDNAPAWKAVLAAQAEREIAAVVAAR